MFRFDIEDRKGLEIVILTALLTFQDANEVIDDGSLTPNLGSKPPLRPSSSSEIVPVPPPKPAPRTGVQRIAEMQALRNEINEITVAEECEVMDYASYCSSLLLVSSDGNSSLTPSASQCALRTMLCYLLP